MALDPDLLQSSLEVRSVEAVRENQELTMMK